MKMQLYYYKMHFQHWKKYINYVYTVDGVLLKVPTDLQNEIKRMFKNMLGLKKKSTKFSNFRI